MANETASEPMPAMPPETAPLLVLQNVYLKDCSYEAPLGPRLDGNWNPQINLDLQSNSRVLSADLREVVLTVTVSAKQNEATIFLVEVKQDHIVVRVTGTSYAASYFRTANSTELLPRNLPLRDDHRAPMSRLEFIKSAWQLAKDKAQQLKWIA